MSAPRESGRLAELLVDQGDEVVAGQLLARMDYGDLASGIRQAQARIQELQARLAEQQAGERPQVIAAAQARVDAARSQVDLAQRELERIQALVQAGVVARSASWINARPAWNKRKRICELLNRSWSDCNWGAARKPYSKFKPKLPRHKPSWPNGNPGWLTPKSRAPFSGVVVQRFAEVGSFVAPTTAASDATAASSSSILALAQGIEVRAEVPEAQIAQVRVGQPVEIRSLAYPDRLVQGRVKRIAPATVVVREVTVFRVFVEPEPGADFLRTGMTVSVDFHWGSPASGSDGALSGYPPGGKPGRRAPAGSPKPATCLSPRGNGHHSGWSYPDPLRSAGRGSGLYCPASWGEPRDFD
jgi:HlyD family secretion protein